MPRISAGSALTIVGIGAGLLVGVDLAWLAAHTSAHDVTWWWPTNWMALPLAAMVFPLPLLGMIILVRGHSEQASKKSEQLRNLVFPSPPPVVGQATPNDFHLFVPNMSPEHLDRIGLPRYVARTPADDQLDEAVEDANFVLVVGRSAAGKSRSAFEAIRKCLSGYRLIVPADPFSLKHLFTPDGPLSVREEPMVVWLDDLTEAHFAEGGLDTPKLVRATESGPRLVVVATIVDTMLSRLRNPPGSSAGWLLRQARQNPSWAREVKLDVLGPSEKADALRIHGEQIEGLIGERFIEGDKLVEQLEYGAGESPEGVAIARAAVDLRRVGLVRQFSRSDLQTAFDPYLRLLKPYDEPSGKAFRRGLDWATQTLFSRSALLVPNDAADAFSPFPYIVSEADRPGSPIQAEIPDPTWNLAIEIADPREALSVGFAALRRDKAEVAERAVIKATTGHDVFAAGAWIQLATMRQLRGDEIGAEYAWRHAAESPFSVVAIQGSFGLGALLLAKGDMGGAKLALQSVLEGPESMAWRARAIIEAIPASAGSPLDTEALLEAAVASGHADASLDLAWFHYHNGDLSDAVQAWQAAEDDDTVGSLARLERTLATKHNDPETAGVVYDSLAHSAVLALGQAAGQVSEGGSAGTESDLLHFTIDTDDGERTMIPVFTRPQLMQDPLLRNPEWQSLAVLLVSGGALLANAHDDVTIVVNPWSPLEFEIPSYKAMAQLRPNDPAPWLAMAEEFALTDQSLEADQAVERALDIRSNDPDVWSRIALVREDQGNVVEQLVALERLLEISPRDAAAWESVGWIHIAHHRDQQAIDALLRAIEVGGETATRWHNIGALRWLTWHDDEAELALRRAIELDSRDSRPWAFLGASYHRTGRLDQAENALQQAIRIDASYSTPWTEVAFIRCSQGRMEELRNNAKRAVELSPERATAANLLLATAAYSDGDLEAARALADLSLAGWETAWQKRTQCDADLLEMKAFALLLEGRIPEASTQLRAALTELPVGRQFKAAYAGVYELAGSRHAVAGIDEYLHLPSRHLNAPPS